MSEPIVVAVDPFREDPDPLALATVLAELTGRTVLAVAAYPQEALAAAGEAPAHDLAIRELVRAGLEWALQRLPVGSQSRAAPGPTRTAAVLDAAEDVDAAVIVVGSAHGGPLGRLVAGDLTDQLLHGASCPVAIAPRGYEPPPEGLRRVGAAFVDAPEGHEALRGAAALARRAGGSLQAVTVIRAIGWGTMMLPMTTAIARERERAHGVAEEALRRALSRLPGGIHGEPVVLEDSTAAALAAFSTELDVLVCGSRGHGTARSVVLGGVSHALSRHAHCPLIVLPHGSRRGLEVLTGEAAAAGRRGSDSIRSGAVAL
jgi:nucleotide-binding universal stress UspA family protein